MKKLLLFSVLFFVIQGLSAQVLYNNGPVANRIGTGAGGADESVLLTTTFTMGTIGFGNQASALNRIADDFVVTDCYWRIDSVAFYGYQTNSTTTSTFTAVNVRLWDSIPAEAAVSNIIFGDTTTNRMISTSWSGVYRITETTTGNTARPIMRNVIDMEGILIPTGTYWLDWQSAGSLVSGPWVAPIALPDTNVTGNGRQRTGQIWSDLLDGGTGNPPQGLPFIIYGEAINITTNLLSSIESCDGISVLLGDNPTASGGMGTLHYAWSPAALLNDSTLAHPEANPLDTTTYYLQVSDSLSCVVFDTIQVNIRFIDNSVTATDSAIIANAVGLTYQWVDCDNSYSEIPSAVSALFEPLVSGNFAVVINDGLCLDTSVCNVITVTGIDEADSRVTLSPNPAEDVVHVSLMIPSEKTEYRLFDQNGRLIKTAIIEDQFEDIVIRELPAGVYSLQILMDNQCSNHVLIIQ